MKNLNSDKKEQKSTDKVGLNKMTIRERVEKYLEGIDSTNLKKIMNNLSEDFLDEQQSFEI